MLPAPASTSGLTEPPPGGATSLREHCDRGSYGGPGRCPCTRTVAAWPPPPPGPLSPLHPRAESFRPMRLLEPASPCPARGAADTSDDAAASDAGLVLPGLPAPGHTCPSPAGTRPLRLPLLSWLAKGAPRVRGFCSSAAPVPGCQALFPFWSCPRMRESYSFRCTNWISCPFPGGFLWGLLCVWRYF